MRSFRGQDVEQIVVSIGINYHILSFGIIHTSIIALYLLIYDQAMLIHKLGQQGDDAIFFWLPSLSYGLNLPDYVIPVRSSNFSRRHTASSLQYLSLNHIYSYLACTTQ